MAKPTAGKWRALRVALRQHSEMDAFERGRLWLTLLAVAVVIGWFLVGFLRGDGGKERFSPGPLSVNHQQFDCATCHDDLSPMRDDVVGASLSGWHKTEGERWDRGADAKCKACHPLAAMPGEVSNLPTLSKVRSDFRHDLIEKPLPIFAHSANEKTEAIESCASCHIEHRGNDVQLTRVNDAACVRCHQELDSKMCDEKKTDFDPNITKFYVTNSEDHPEGHPEFSSLLNDPGTLRGFSHHGHMKPLEDKTKNWDPSVKVFADQDGMVQLQCAFCHGPVGSEPGVASANSDSTQLSGTSELMTMPTYEQSCKVCHPLEISMGRWKKQTDSSEEIAGPVLKIEHGLSPDQIRKRIIDFVIVTGVESIGKNVETVREEIDPGTKLTAEQEKLADQVWDAIDKQITLSPVSDLRVLVEKDESKLRQKCFECHMWSDSDEQKTAADMVGPVKTIEGGNDVFLKSWFQHGRFDHSAHRDVSCATCHDASSSEKSSDTLIAGHLKCAECHQPILEARKPNQLDAQFKRAATYNCTSCHTYHGGGNRAYHFLNKTSK